MAKANFCPLGDFFKPCPSKAKAGFTLQNCWVSLEKSPSGFLMIIPIYIKASKSEFEILLMISALKIYN
ncbi:hypothetical protein [uncultured Gammaproteobacteria bacterium]|uniref:Uncharacterized protein n=1 Tax=Bathymodiolus thermophilus thioautotrophic gill symbiont TaxID=2360 RepID=A0ABM8M8G3_9GAMM|nr:hypothetical protein AZO1586I_1277 [Bathymodiolus thermophilus thioautotrophic gill symbiont]CAC9516533.1 hypothetical protein [uncultured Gammaproteobacteria bacterium]CAC9978949.1 hypothetical protein [uncultured Gammaproteobacteria bacterium]CAC9993894.1 hypothetical protein [uncultured Gammaproteobacteria bacterium]